MSSNDLMTIVINDQPHQVDTSLSVERLLSDLGYTDTRGLAVAVNDCVHPRSGWGQQRLQPDDRVTLIRAAAGG